MGSNPEAAIRLGLLSELVLNSTDVDPANAVFISPEDTLYLVVWPSVGAVTITTNLRVLTPEGAINISRYDYVTAGTRSPQVQILPLGQGQVLGVVINAFAANNLRRGQCYVALMFLRGSITSTTQFTQVLCAGYLTSLTPLFYPLGRVDGSMDGVGNSRSVTGTTPGAGAEISETVPAGAAWQLITLTASLTASAVVANRNVHLVIDDGANTLYRSVWSISQTASQNVMYSGSLNAGQPASDTSIVVALRLPPQMLLMPGWRIRTLTNGLDVGDQWTAPQYNVQELLQP